MYLSMTLIVFGNILYHIGQKNIPRLAEPLIALCLMYSVAIALAVVCFGYVQGVRLPTVETLSTCSTWVVIVGIGAACIELGFLLAYRAGGSMTLVTLGVTALSMIILLPIDVLLLKAQISPLNWVGIVLGVFSVIFMSIK